MKNMRKYELYSEYRNATSKYLKIMLYTNPNVNTEGSIPQLRE